MNRRTAFVQTADLRVFDRVSGVGEPVVFIHGFPQTGHQWRFQQDALSEAGYATFAPDNRGFGATEKPLTRVSRWLLAQDVINYLDARGIGECTLVGHDWGGIIAFKAAVDHPHRITKLVLIDTLCTVWRPQSVHGFWFKAEGLAEEFFERHHRAFIDVLFGGADAGILGGRPYNPWPIPPGKRAPTSWIATDDLDHYRESFRDPSVWWNAVSYYRYGAPFHAIEQDGVRSLSETQVAQMWMHPDGLEAHPQFGAMEIGPEDTFKTYEHPCLWLYGSYVGRVLSEGQARVPRGNPFDDQFSRYFPDLTARSVAGHHFLAEECPRYVNETILQFLARQTDESPQVAAHNPRST